MNHLPSITKEAISELPVEIFPGRIIIIDQLNDIKKAVAAISSEPYVGFDTETRPNFSKKQFHKVSLIQISLEDTCYLFRLNKLGGIPDLLIDFLKDDQITKIGLSLQDDFHAIKKLVHIDPVNFIDLQKYVPNYGIKDTSLQKIYAILFGRKISKKTRLSNWEIEELTEAQQKYAALDAWACLRIYQYLNQL